jgi:hypothetical protein
MLFSLVFAKLRRRIVPTARCGDHPTRGGSPESDRSGRALCAPTPAIGQSVCKLVSFQLLAARLRGTTGFPPRSEAPILYLVQTVGTVLVTRRTPTDACIPFLFNLSSTLRLRRPPTERHVSLLLSCPCGRSPLQRTGTPPSFTQSVLREGPLFNERLFQFMKLTDYRAVESDSGHCNRPSIGIIIFPPSTGCSFTPARCNSDVAGTVPASGIALSSAGRRYFTHA